MSLPRLTAHRSFGFARVGISSGRRFSSRLIVPQACEAGCNCMPVRDADRNPENYRPCRSTVEGQQCFCLKSPRDQFMCADLATVQEYVRGGGNIAGWTMPEGAVCRVYVDNQVPVGNAVASPIAT